MLQHKHRPLTTEYFCRVCGCQYDRDDDITEPTPWHDPDWNPADFRCYCCYLKLCYEIFGGYMKPCFFVGGKAILEDGRTIDEHGGDTEIEPSDVPF